MENIIELITQCEIMVEVLSKLLRDASIQAYNEQDYMRSVVYADSSDFE